MKLSPNTHRQLESLFRMYFDDENLKLPEIELYVRRGARIVAKILSIYGITFGRFMFIQPDLLYRNSDLELCISKELLAHEATHVLQYQRLGWFRFFFNYLKGY